MYEIWLLLAINHLTTRRYYCVYSLTFTSNSITRVPRKTFTFKAAHRVNASGIVITIVCAQYTFIYVCGYGRMRVWKYVWWNEVGMPSL